MKKAPILFQHFLMLLQLSNNLHNFNGRFIFTFFSFRSLVRVRLYIMKSVHIYKSSFDKQKKTENNAPLLEVRNEEVAGCSSRERMQSV